MRIVSWNIRAGGGRRSEQIAEQIERWQPDIVALQEFRDTPPSRRLSEALRCQGLAFQRSTADRERPAANAILLAARWPLRRIGLSTAPSEARRWAAVRIAAPRPFSLGAMHAPNRVSGRKYPFLDSVLRLASTWRAGPALMIGDTNSGRIGIDEEAPAFNRREDAWISALEAAGWRDAFRALHGEAHAYTWYSPNAGNGFRLDQCFINGALLPRLRGARYKWGSAERRDGLSDHAALIVDLES